MLRSCTSGYSVVIDSLGRVVADMPLFTTGYLNAEVPVYKRTMTTYSRFGNWMIYVLFVLAFLYSIYLFIILQKEKKYYKDLQIEFDSLPREPDEEEEFAEFLFSFIMKNKEKIYKEFLKMKEKDTNPKKRTSKKKQSKEENNEAD
jgi:hypothetical protein